MSTTLTNGFKLPDSGDKGAILFADLEFNIQRTNDHNHDGSNSSKISSSGLLHSSQLIEAANWVAWQDGIFRQAITTVGGLDASSYGIVFKDSNGGRYMLDTETISGVQYYVYSNDNTLEVTALYV